MTPLLKANDKFVVITFAYESDMGYGDVVTHEVMHAQFFTDSQYQATCAEFWKNNVEQADKEKVKTRFENHYDVSDEFLLLNEFQAYILMSGADVSLLWDHVSKYREPLINALKSTGRTPIQVGL